MFLTGIPTRCIVAAVIALRSTPCARTASFRTAANITVANSTTFGDVTNHSDGRITDGVAAATIRLILNQFQLWDNPRVGVVHRKSTVADTKPLIIVQLPTPRVLAMIASIILTFIFLLLTIACKYKIRDRRLLFRSTTRTAEDKDDDVNDLTYVVMDADELLEHMGLGGLALKDMSSKGFSGVTLRRQVPGLALQSWILQFGMLYFLLTRLQPARTEKELPVFMVFMSIYLHLLSCIGNLPLGLSIICNLHEIHSGLDLTICRIVFIVDQIILPCCTVVVGGLYLCTSRGVADLILNSCAVAFIGQIDDWIMTFNVEAKRCAGVKGDCTLFFPTNVEMNALLNGCMSQVPIVPAAVSIGLVYLGMFVLYL